VRDTDKKKQRMKKPRQTAPPAGGVLVQEPLASPSG
jgi:hypothetical protein